MIKNLLKNFITLAAKRKDAINKYCWNEEKGFYFDYDYINSSQKTSLTLASAFPLYFKIASSSQADKVAGIIERIFFTTRWLNNNYRIN